MEVSDALYWNPHSRLLHSIRAANDATQPALLLDRTLFWLVANVAGFRPANEAVTKQVQEARCFVFSRIGKVVVEPRLRQATAELSRLLDLDAVQTHILLKRWLKASGREAALRAAPAGVQQELSAADVLDIVAQYHHERLSLLRALQLVLLTAASDAPASKVCAQATSKMLTSGLAEHLLRAYLSNLMGAAAGDASGAGRPSGAAARVDAAAVAAPDNAAASCGGIVIPREYPGVAYLQILAERAHLAAALTFCHSMHGAACSAEHFSMLVSRMGHAMFRSGAAAGTAGGGGGGGAGDSSGVAAAAQLAQALGCVLLMAALRTPELLAAIAAAGAGAGAEADGDAGSVRLTASAAPLAGMARSIDAHVRAWSSGAAAAPMLLTWAAYLKLLATYHIADDLGSDEHQARAMEAGGFDAVTSMLSLEGFGAEDPLQASALRGVLLQSVCLVATAFDLSCWRLPASLLSDLVLMVAKLVDGFPELSATVWDASQAATAPLRALLDSAAALFPAFPRPLLTLLASLAQGAAGATQAFQVLRREVVPVVLHSQAEQELFMPEGSSGSELTLSATLPWNQAPEVDGSVLPRGCRGRVLPLPAFAAEQFGADWRLVQWQVEAEAEGTGQVFMLARVAHCLLSLTRDGAGVDSTDFQDLAATLHLLQQLLREEPLLASPLQDASIAFKGDVRLDWLTALTACMDVLPKLGRDALPALADALRTARGLAAAAPHRVMLALAGTSLLQGCQLTGAGRSSAHVCLEDLPCLDGRQLASALDARLPSLEALQANVEGPTGTYPVTSALLDLLAALLKQEYAGGPMTNLVLWSMHGVLGNLAGMRFRSATERWRLAASALEVVRLAILAGATRPGGPAPKAAGPPAGVCLTPLAASILRQLAVSGHGALAGVLPPPAPALERLLEERGASGAAAACLAATEQLLLLAPMLLATLCTFPADVPLQQWWYQELPATGIWTGAPATAAGTPPTLLTPASVLASYAAWPFGSASGDVTRVPQLGVRAMHAFAQSLPAGHAAAPGTIRHGGVSCAAVVPRSRSAHGGADGAASALGAYIVAGLVRPWHPTYVDAYPEWLVAASALTEVAVRHHPDLLDSLCFPTALELAPEPAAAQGGGGDENAAPGSTVAAGEGGDGDAKRSRAHTQRQAAPAAAKGPGPPPSASALDGLWAVLQRGPSLMRTHPEVVGGALRVLAAMWERRSAAQAAVETLRAQPGFWQALEALAPDPAALSDLATVGDPSALVAAAWRLQAHACVLHILLLEALAPPQQLRPGGGAAAGKHGGGKHALDGVGGAAAASAGAAARRGDTPGDAALQQLLSGWGPGGAKLPALLVAAARLPLEQVPVVQLLGVVQATYLQLGASSVGAAWGGAAEWGRVAAGEQLHAEVAPLLQLLADGRCSVEDLAAACQLLASGNDAMEGDGAEVAEQLRGAPLGRVLLEAVAVTPQTLTLEATEYGRAFLMDAQRLEDLLCVRFDDLSTPPALAMLMDDASCAAGAVHAQLALLHSAHALLAALAHAPPAGGSAAAALTDVSAANRLLEAAVETVGCCVEAHRRLEASPAAALVAAPWGLRFLRDAGQDALLVSARALGAAVRTWKGHQGRAAAAARAAAARGGSGRGAASGAVGALLVRMGDRGGGAQGGGSPGRRGGARVGAPPRQHAAAVGDALAPAAAAAATRAAAATARLLAGWLHAHATPGGHAAVAACEGAVVESLATALLLLLQEAPVSTGGGGGDGVPGAELKAALLELLQPLCAASCVAGGAAAAHAAAVDAVGALVSAAEQRAAALQLLLQLLSCELPAEEWLPMVTARLPLVALMRAAAARLRGGAAGQSPAEAGSAAAAAAQGAADISLLEVATAVAQEPAGALALVQHGALPAVADLMRALLEADGGRLGSGGGGEDAYVAAPAAAGAGGGAAAWSPLHQQWCVLLGVAAALLQHGGMALEVGGAAMDVLVAGEARLLRALAAPGASPRRPLTLAASVEAERALALLARLALYSGHWQCALPASLGAFRTAAAALVNYAALPSLQPPGASDGAGQSGGGGGVPRPLQPCPPQTPFERRLAARPANGLDATCVGGWLSVCAVGSGGAAPGSSQGPSEYAARMAEAQYACAALALGFLAATSPQVAVGEAAQLGRMWPKRSALLAVAGQCAGLGRQLLAGGERSGVRRRRLAACCARIMRLAAPLLEALGVAREAHARVREDCAMIQRALTAG